MDPLASLVVRRFLEAQEEPRTMADGVVYESDLHDLTPEDKAHWKGYSLRLEHATYSKEEFEDIGDTANRKTEHAGPFTTLEALAKHLEPLKWAEWLDPAQGLLGGKPKKDRKGGATQTDAYVERKDGAALNREERDFLSGKLKIPV